MVAYDLPGARTAAAGLLTVIVLAVPVSGGAQPVLDRNDLSAERRIVDAIVQTEQRSGRNAPELIDPLTALGVLYQEDGDHGPAAQAFTRALQVVRVNYGLYTLDQAPLLDQAIRNQEAQGNVAAAWELEHELAALARRNPDDVRAASILRSIGVKRLAQLDLYASGKVVPQIALGCYYQHPSNRVAGSCVAGSRGAAIRWMNADVQEYLHDAVALFHQHGLYSSAELEDVEREIVRASYAYGGSRHDYGHHAGYSVGSYGYGHGRESLKRLLEYTVARSEPVIERIRAFVEIADWDLLTATRPDLARGEYQQAYEQLVARSVPQAQIDELFAPELPVALPVFVANPLHSPETPTSKGFVDVAFEITEQGRAQRVDILGTSTNASFAEKRSIAQLVHRSRFRPRVVDGAIAAAAPVTIRYYLND
jgi:hypothetical protein